MNRSASSPPKSARRRWPLLTALTVAVLGAAIAARTALLEAALDAWLAARGIAPAELRVSELDWHALVIEEVRLTEQLTVARIDVGYRLSEVLQGRVDALDITGLRLDVSDLDGGIVALARRELATAPAGGTEQALPRVTLHDAQVSVRLAGVDVTSRLSGAMRPDGTVRVELLDARVSAPGVASFTLSGQADYDGAQVTAGIAAQPVGRTERIALAAAFDPAAGRADLTLSPLAFAPDGLQPGDVMTALAALGPVRGTVSGEGVITLSSAGAAVDAQVSLTGAGLSRDALVLDDGAATIALHVPAGTREVSLRVTDGRAVLAADGQRAQVDGLAAHGRVDLDTWAVDATVDEARLSHPWLAPLSMRGDVSLVDGQADFAMRAGDGVLSVSGKHDLATGRGTAAVQAGPWRFAPGGLQPLALSPLLAAMEDVSGGLSGQADLAWDAQGLGGAAQVTLDDLSLTSGAVRVEGLSGALAFAELTPPHMDGVQTLRARRLDGGVAALSNLRLGFRLDRDGKLFIDHGEAGLAGGVIALDDQVIDVFEPRHGVTLAFERLDLARLFGLLNLDGVSGQGRLSGTVPLSITAQTVTIADGHFAAIGPGVLRMRSGAVRQALGGAGADAALLLDVLEDFNYQTLDLRLDKDGGGEAVVRLSTAGSNPAVMDGYPFQINVNLTTRLDKVLATLSTAMRLSQQALRDTLKALK